MNDIHDLENKPIGKLLWLYALPAVITQVVASIYNIVDRVFLGQYVGELAIAGLAITLPLMNIIHAFGAMVGVGASARMSIVLGRKDVHWAEKILGNSIILTFIFGAMFVTAGYLFMDQILELFGASRDTIGYAREYMRIVLPGMFFTTLSFNLTGLIRASGYPTKSMWIMGGGAVLNIILDALFICVLGLGIAGAAWATTISMVSMAMVAVLHFVQPKSFIRFRRHGWTPKFYIFRNVLLIGLSPFLMNFAASFVVALLNRQLIHYGGDLAVGAYGVVNTYGSFLVMFRRSSSRNTKKPTKTRINPLSSIFPLHYNAEKHFSSNREVLFLYIVSAYECKIIDCLAHSVANQKNYCYLCAQM